MKDDILLKFENVKLFLFDLEGVLTHSDYPEEKCIELISNACLEFNKLELIFGIVTARKDDELIKKLKEIKGCNVLAAALDKVSAVDEFLKLNSLDYENVFYIGDDLLDIQLLKKSKVSAAPNSARREVKRVVNFILKSDKCEDLIQEIISAYINSKEKPSRATKS
jgi:3-deoxy-D-manno-octulosonate 8-phosphate phosphatase (KDO 8-P phosphatase)